MTFWTTAKVLTAAALLRVGFLLYGLYQDAYSPLKYTDIDYFVFTDATRFVAQGGSPYERDTYRYTPLLAWLLLPTTWTDLPGGRTLWFSFGKIIFAAADIFAGWLLILMLRRPALPVQRLGLESGRPPRKPEEPKYPRQEAGQAQPQHEGLSNGTALKYASFWLFNPMVATISTRGSAEGLLGALVLATLWALLRRRIVLSGILLGFAVHFKIYPFIYALTFLLFLHGSQPLPSWKTSPLAFARSWLNPDRVRLGLSAFASFMACNVLSYAAYGSDFLQHAYLYHLTRSDHRHNFSPYSTLLYASSAAAASSDPAASKTWLSRLPTIAFIPQLLLSAVILPLAMMPSLPPGSSRRRASLERRLPSTLMAQTLAFVALNKVCTSQYFLWYLCFLPLHLAVRRSPPRARDEPVRGVRDAVFVALWVGTQAVWLWQGYRLEFLGESTFVPGLWGASLAFYLANMLLLGVVIEDVSFVE